MQRTTTVTRPQSDQTTERYAGQLFAFVRTIDLLTGRIEIAGKSKARR